MRKINDTQTCRFHIIIKYSTFKSFKQKQISAPKQKILKIFSTVIEAVTRCGGERNAKLLRLWYMCACDMCAFVCSCA